MGGEHQGRDGEDRQGGQPVTGKELITLESLVPDQRPARQVLQEATERASAVAAVIERQHCFVIISGKKYVEYEGWSAIAAQYNLIPDIEWSRRLEGGGWEARAALIHLPTGRAISHAESICGTPDDGAWANRSTLAQRSMAETRAASKVCRLALSWVMVLAGFQATPAEEMIDSGVSPKRKARGSPSGGSRIMAVKYSGRCPGCQELLEVGTDAVFSFEDKKLRHPECAMSALATPVEPRIGEEAPNEE